MVLVLLAWESMMVIVESPEKTSPLLPAPVEIQRPIYMLGRAVSKIRGSEPGVNVSGASDLK
jgi:hypothetical protein